METIVGYIVVAEGGEYSDAYHYNQQFYLDRSEAVAYIESKKESAREWNRFVALCPSARTTLYGDDKRPLGEAEADILFPPGTPNRRSLMDAKIREIQSKASAAWKIEILKICEDNFPHLIEQVKGLHWLNKEDEETDLEIEEIDIPVGSRLYKLLKVSE